MGVDPLALPPHRLLSTYAAWVKREMMQQEDGPEKWRQTVAAWTAPVRGSVPRAATAPVSDADRIEAEARARAAQGGYAAFVGSGGDL